MHAALVLRKKTDEMARLEGIGRTSVENGTAELLFNLITILPQLAIRFQF
jgi:hypothetical protein